MNRYRFQLKLSAQFDGEPEPTSGYVRTVDRNVTEIDVVADTIGDAVRQAHAFTSMLLARHDDTNYDDVAIPPSTDAECPF